jgi:hypothetical protein
MELVKPQEKKKAYLSKTLWVNLIMGVIAVIAAFYPPLAEMAPKIEGMLLVVFPVINVVLRMITKDELYLSE